MRRVDPATGAEMRLAPEGLTIAEVSGTTRFVPAPPGFSLSHFEADGRIVARGERPLDGWWDWHFELEGDSLRRAGPAY